MLGFVFPDDLAFVSKVQRIDDIRKWRMHVHHVANDKWRTFVSTQDTRRKRPRDLQIADVFGIDLGQLGIALVFIVAGLNGPLSGVVHLGH